MAMFYVVHICVIQLELTFNWGFDMLCKTRHSKKPQSVLTSTKRTRWTFPSQTPNPNTFFSRMTFLWIESKSKLKISITIQISYWSFDYDSDFHFLIYFDFDFDSSIGKNSYLFRFRFSISITSPANIIVAERSEDSLGMLSNRKFPSPFQAFWRLFRDFTC
jgi:hypothetical protein